MADDCKGMALLRRALGAMPERSAWAERIGQAVSGKAPVGVHLAVFVEPYLQAVLDGRKTVESRFGVHRCAPFDKVRPGDLILLKRSGGPVVGLALAGAARYHELDGNRLGELRDEYASRLFAEDDEFWATRSHKKYASLIDIDDTVEIATLDIDKRDRRGWVTYVEGRQACLALEA